MKLIRNAVVVGAVAAASVAACSSQQGSSTAGTGHNGGSPTGSLLGNGGDMGSIHAALTIADGSLYSLNYTCTGPAVIPSGTVNFNDAQSVEWVLGGIPAGTGYQCTLSGTDTNGDPCAGTTSSFPIIAGAVTGATVVVTCNVPTDASTLADVNTGSVGFDASVVVNQQGAYACPGINAFSISPSEVIGSQTAQLGVNEIGPVGLAADGGPTTSDIVWTATCGTPPCGTFSNPNGTTPTFTCGPDLADQIVTITAQVTNYETNVATGVTSDVCAGAKFTTIQATIDCEGGGTFSCVGTPATPNACSTDAGVNTCVNFSTDVNNCGSCFHVCPAPPAGDTETCQSGTCTAVAPPAGGPCTQLVGGVPADNTGNTKCVQCDQNTTKLCTNTEAIIVTRDQEKGLINAAGTAPTAASCYECAVNAGDLDSTVQGFSGEECDDLTGTALQLCLNALNCYLGSPQAGTAGITGTNSGATASALAADCTNESPAGVYNCFCGPAEPDVSDCKAADTVAQANTSGGLGVASPNGACINQILAGTGTTTSTVNPTVITDLSNTALGAGEASALVQLWGTNLTSGQACPVCYK